MIFCFVYFDFERVIWNMRVIKMDIDEVIFIFFGGEVNGEVFIVEIGYLSFFFVFGRCYDRSSYIFYSCVCLYGE